MKLTGKPDEPGGPAKPGGPCEQKAVKGTIKTHETR